MDIAEFGLGLVGGALECGGVGNIHLDRAGADVEGGEFAARDLELRLFDIGEHDIDAVARQRPADAKADAVGSPRDKGGLAREIHHERPERIAGRAIFSDKASKPSIIRPKRRSTSGWRSAWVKT